MRPMNHTPEHPANEELAAFALGQETANAETVADHVANCSRCETLIAETPRTTFLSIIDNAKRESSFGGRYRPKIAPSAADELPPELRQQSKYTFLKKLGGGGMGVVYLAEHNLMKRKVAVKLIPPDLIGNPAVRERFLQEVVSAAALEHPNVVRAYSAEEFGRHMAFEMEFVDGLDLGQLVKAKGPLPVNFSVNYIRQAAQALQHGMLKSLVHRDIKPGNLLLTRAGSVKVADFGLAKFSRESEKARDHSLTGANAMMGTPDYMAPEQARNPKTADIRADIYSLGCTFYYLLAGRPPFTGESLADLIFKHWQDARPDVGLLRNDVPVELAQYIQKMMGKEPAGRPQTPKEVVDWLTSFAKGESTNKQAFEKPNATAAPGSAWNEVLQSKTTRAASARPEASAVAPKKSGQPSGAFPLDDSGPITNESLAAGIVDAAPVWDAPQARKRKRKSAKSKLPLYIGGLLAVSMVAAFAFQLSRPEKSQPTAQMVEAPIIVKPPVAKKQDSKPLKLPEKEPDDTIDQLTEKSIAFGKRMAIIPRAGAAIIDFFALSLEESIGPVAEDLLELINNEPIPDQLVLSRTFDGANSSFGLGISRDGTRLYVSSPNSAEVRVHDVLSGAQIDKFENPGGAVLALTVCPDNTVIVQGAKTVAVWDPNAKDRQVRCQIPVDVNPMVFAVTAKDGRIYVPDAPRVKMYSLENGKLVNTLVTKTKDSLRNITCTPDGDAYAGVTAAGEINVRPRKAPSYSIRHEFIRTATFSPDGKYLLGWSSAKPEMVIFDAETGKEAKTLRGHEHSVKDATFTPDGQFILSISSDKTLRLWNTESGAQLQQISLKAEGISVRVSADARFAVTGASNGEQIQLWKLPANSEPFDGEESPLILAKKFNNPLDVARYRFNETVKFEVNKAFESRLKFERNRKATQLVERLERQKRAFDSTQELPVWLSAYAKNRIRVARDEFAKNLNAAIADSKRNMEPSKTADLWRELRGLAPQATVTNRSNDIIYVAWVRESGQISCEAQAWFSLKPAESRPFGFVPYGDRFYLRVQRGGGREVLFENLSNPKFFPCHSDRFEFKTKLEDPKMLNLKRGENLEFSTLITDFRKLGGTGWRIARYFEVGAGPHSLDIYP